MRRTRIIIALLTTLFGLAAIGAVTAVGDKVGIGTTPSEALHVVGNVRFSGSLLPNNSAGSSGQVLTSAGPGVPPTWTTTASSGITGTGTNGAVTFWTGATVVGSKVASFFWDDTNNRLGLGNNTPSEVLDVTGNVRFSGALMPNNQAGTAGFVLQSNGPGVAPTWVIPGGGGAVTTLAPVGAAPNANAANISGATLNLQPASQTFPGVVTALTQTFGGTPKILQGSSTGPIEFQTSQTNSAGWAQLSVKNSDSRTVTLQAIGSTYPDVTIQNWGRLSVDAALTGFDINLNGNKPISLSTGGTLTERMRIEGNGNVRFNNTNNTLFIDAAAQSVSIGTTSNSGGQLAVQKTNTNANILGVVFSNTAADRPRFHFLRYRGTPGAQAAVQTGDILGDIPFRGSDAAAATWEGANISAVVNTTFTSLSAPTDLLFSTTPSGSTGPPVERLRLFANGNARFDGTDNTAFVDAVNNRTGFGTATPSERVDVSGNVRFSGALMPNNLPGTSGQVLTSAGSGTAPTWTTPATSVTTLAAVGAAPNANAATLTGSTLNLEPASATFPGVVTTGAQTFAGAKTFSGNISASNLSGSNSGDITITGVGAAPNGSAASLSGQALTLQPADATNPGVVTSGAQTFGGIKTFSGNISANNLSGTNSGDITMAAVGSVPNANGAALAGQVLTLQPASASFPGVVSTAAQSFAGAKTFTGNVTADSFTTESGTFSSNASVTPLTLVSSRIDGLGSVGVRINTPAYTSTGSKLFQVQNNGVEKMFIDKDGGLQFTGDLRPNSISGLLGQVLTSQGVGTPPIWTTPVTAVTTLSAVGAAPNANAATITGSTLNLQPANASFPGVVTTGTQTLAGDKSLSGNTTLGDAAGDTTTITGTAVATPNGLNFDANTLTLDSVNNRIGIGTASPQFELDVQGSSIFTDIILDGPVRSNGAGTTGQVLTSQGAGVAPIWTDSISGSGGAGNVAFFTSANVLSSTGNLSWDNPTSTLTTVNSTVISDFLFGGPFLANGDPGTSGQVLTSAGAGVAPTWETPAAGGVTTMAPVGASPNANAGTISGTTLNLEPADATNPGVVTTGTQTFAGNKTVTGSLGMSGEFLPGGSAGTTGQVLTSAGPGVAPTWATPAAGFSATTGALDLYVTAAGSDANDCSIGAPCRQVQAAIAKIPNVVRHPVTVNVGTGGYNGFSITNFLMQFPANPSIGAYIWVKGTRVTPTISQGVTSGTFTGGVTGTNATPSTGVLTGANWLATELRGRFVRFTSGALSGQIRPIATNTNDTITFPGSLSASGLSFVIEEPGPVFNTPLVSAPADPSGGASANIATIWIGNNQGGMFESFQSGGTRANIRVDDVLLRGGSYGLKIFGDSTNIACFRCWVDNGRVSIINSRTVYLAEPSISNSSEVTVYLETVSSFTMVNGIVRGGSSPGAIYSLGTDKAQITGSRIEGWSSGAKGLVAGSGAWRFESTTYFVCPSTSSQAVWVGDVFGNIAPYHDNGGNFVFDNVNVSSCGTAFMSRSPGATIRTTNTVGTGNTTAYEVYRGGRINITNTGDVTATNQVRLDGTSNTYANLRAASPALLQNTYGSIIFDGT